MRGKERGHGIRLQHSGITPAYAGKSEIFELSHNLKKDHPRLCGEKRAVIVDPSAASGSPPPMRGKGFSVQVQDAPYRITPAYAGKSRAVPPDGLKM